MRSGHFAFPWATFGCQVCLANDVRPLHKYQSFAMVCAKTQTLCLRLYISTRTPAEGENNLRRLGSV